FSSFHSLRPRPPTPTLFPYTTLFRSRASATKMPSRRTETYPHEIHRGPSFPPTKSRSAADIAQQRHSLCSCPEARQRNILQSDLDRKSTRLNSSHLGISYAVFCLKKK